MKEGQKLLLLTGGTDVKADLLAIKVLLSPQECPIRAMPIL